MSTRTDTERLAWVCWSSASDVQRVQLQALSLIGDTGMSEEERAWAIRKAIDQQIELELRCAAKLRMCVEVRDMKSQAIDDEMDDTNTTGDER